MWKYLTSAKYRFFKRKLYAVQATMWETEFKIAKSRQVREGVRQDRDRAKEAINQLEAGLASAKDADQREYMQNELFKHKENVERYEKQMKMVDDQINGAVGDAEHEPVIGLLEQVKSYVELKLMYEQYISEI